jgi:hypothetical protein
MSRTRPETELAELLHRLADHARTEPSVGPQGLVAEPRRRPVLRSTTGMVAAAVIVIALVAASLTLRDGDERRVVTGGFPGLLGGTTVRLGATSLAGRTGASSVWTGKELLVWGGLTLVGSENRWPTDGAALDPETNRWRPLPPAPIGARSYAATVWTGTEMLVWGGGSPDGGMRADGAAFDPRTNTWRMIASQPGVGATRPVATWTGTEMLVVSSINAPSATTAYNPTTDRWRRLAAPPGALAMPYPQGVWTGKELVLLLWPNGSTAGVGPASPTLTVTPVHNPPADPLAGSDADHPPPTVVAPVLPPGGGPNSNMFLASYSPVSDQWTRLPAVALTDGSLPLVVWTGREVLVIQSSQPGAAFDPASQAWRPLSSMPATPASIPSQAVWTGHLALFWSGGTTGLAYDPVADAWLSFDAGGLRERHDAVVVWADGFFVGWSGFNNQDDGSGRLENDGIRYRPPSR